MEKLARRMGKLLKKGEPDIKTVSKMVLNDWQRGKLPFFVMPPQSGDIKPVEDPQTVDNFNSAIAVEQKFDDFKSTLDFDESITEIIED